MDSPRAGRLKKSLQKHWVNKMNIRIKLDEYLAAYQRRGVSARQLCRDKGLHERFLYGLSDGSSVRNWRLAVETLGIDFQIFFGESNPDKIINKLLEGTANERER